jgi:PAS domain S-box-containing protein
MTGRHPFSLRKADLFWVAVSLFILLPCLYYPHVAHSPNLGFDLDSTSWAVFDAKPCATRAPCIQIGDRLLALGGIEFRQFHRSFTLDLVSAYGSSGATTARVLRNGRVLSIPVRLRADEPLLRGEELIRIFPLIFWLVGTFVVIFLRPRDERWLVLVLFHYVTAIWFASGLAAGRHSAGSCLVFHFFIWLSLPLSVHLHAILPTSLLGRRRWMLLAPLYGLAFTLMALDFLQLLRPGTHLLFFLAGVALSFGLLLLRFLLPAEPAVKVANRIMLYGVVLGFAPIIAFWVVAPVVLQRISMREPGLLYPWVLGISLITIPILPMSYIYAIYKHYLGALEFRANRLLGVYSFGSLCITVYLVILFLVTNRWAAMSRRPLAATVTVSLLFVASAPYLRNRFQAVVDRHIFRIRHSPEEVVGIVSERIPTAFNRVILAQVIVDEILPTLLIRQSALHLFAGDGVETLYVEAPPGEPPPSAGELRALLAQSARYLSPRERSAHAHAWVRLVIPLTLQAETLGAWLIGRRDPDDFYPTSDIRLLSNVANQIAAVVENIRLYERAQQEIAQRRTAEEEIRRSEERFRNLFEATLEGIAIVRGGVVLEVNQALLAIFGYSEAAELIGRQLSDLIPEGDAALTAVPREGAGVKRDGSTVDIEIAGKMYVFQGEDVTVVAIRDIERRKRDEAENKMLQRQLLHSQKMEAIGRLSAGIAHDFNNCLLAIFGYSDLLLARHGGDDFLARNLTGIKDAGQKAAALTKQLLAFTRQQPMEAQVMDLNAVVSGLEKMLQRLIGEDIELITDLHPGLGKVRVDPGQMEQVILNLAVNARHAMPTGGRLTLRTSPLAIAAGTTPPHGKVPAGDYVLLTVADTGTGMDAETQLRIFEPFFSTKDVGEGTGLGLSTVYGIVKQSKGHIAVDSGPGKGAVFSIFLPVTAEQPAAVGRPAEAGADRGSETILLVEDENEVRALLYQILCSKGYRVLQAPLGSEALALAARFEEPIHLLLTDVIMPRMKGPELASRLLAERPQTRVIYMSGYNEEQIATGDDGPVCLQKPFSAAVLAQAVRSVLDGAGRSQAVA